MCTLLACQVRLVGQSLVEAELSEVTLLLDRLLSRPHTIGQHSNARHALAGELLIVVSRFVLLRLLHCLSSSIHDLRKVNATILLETAVQVSGSCLGIQARKPELGSLGTSLLAPCPVDGGIGECTAQVEGVVRFRVGLDELVVKDF